MVLVKAACASAAVPHSSDDNQLMINLKLCAAIVGAIYSRFEREFSSASSSLDNNDGWCQHRMRKFKVVGTFCNYSRREIKVGKLKIEPLKQQQQKSKRRE
jgi:hypothetical protein